MQGKKTRKIYSPECLILGGGAPLEESIKIFGDYFLGRVPREQVWRVKWNVRLIW